LNVFNIFEILFLCRIATRKLVHHQTRLGTSGVHGLLVQQVVGKVAKPEFGSATKGIVAVGIKPINR
jgi:hypothetical protein